MVEIWTKIENVIKKMDLLKSPLAAEVSNGMDRCRPPLPIGGCAPRLNLSALSPIENSV